MEGVGSEHLDEEPDGEDAAGEGGCDSDGDGTPDACDDCPDDPEKTAPGNCGCGVEDTTLAGDLDCDGDVDLDDRIAMNELLGLCAADIDGDGEVNGADFAYVLGYWGVCSAP